MTWRVKLRAVAGVKRGGEKSPVRRVKIHCHRLLRSHLKASLNRVSRKLLSALASLPARVFASDYPDNLADMRHFYTIGI